METRQFLVELTREDAEKLRGTIHKHESWVVIDRVKKEILRQLDEDKKAG